MYGLESNLVTRLCTSLLSAPLLSRKRVEMIIRIYLKEMIRVVDGVVIWVNVAFVNRVVVVIVNRVFVLAGAAGKIQPRDR